MKKFGFVSAILLSILLLVLVGQRGFAADESLVLYLPFDEGTGSVVKDLSGKGNDGEVLGASWANGQTNMALEFDGTGYVKVPHSDSLSPSAEITIMAWVLAKAGQSDELMIISKGHWAANDLPYELSIYPPGGVIYCQFYDDAGRDGCSPAAPTYDVWHHIAATYDGSAFKCYIDGVFAKDFAYSGKLPQNDASVTIGRRSKADEAYFFGKIDEVAIFNRALNEDEVMNAMSGLDYFAEASVNAIDKLPVVWGRIK